MDGIASSKRAVLMQEVGEAGNCVSIQDMGIGELQVIDEESGNATRETTGLNGEELPYYVTYLNHLLGPQQANEYLNPTAENMTVSASGGILRVGVNKLPRRSGGLVREVTSLSKRTYSANQLWTLLREDTQADITDLEAKSYDKLRDAYDSLVRQCVVQKNMPAVLKDLKSLEWNAFQRLMQRSTLSRLQEQRRLQELMFHIAKSNAAKQDIILHNIMLPDFTNRWGNESVNHFVPDEYRLELETFRARPRKMHSKNSTMEFSELVKEFQSPRNNSCSSPTTYKISSHMGSKESANLAPSHTKTNLPGLLTPSHMFLRDGDNHPNGQFRKQMDQLYTVPTIFEKTLKDAQKCRETETAKQLKEIQHFLVEDKFLNMVKARKIPKPIKSKAISASASQIYPSQKLNLSSMLQHAHTKSYVPPRTSLNKSKERGNFHQLPFWNCMESIHP